MKERLVGALLWLLARQGKGALLPWAFDRIRSLFSEEPQRYLDFLETYQNRENWIYRFFAAHQAGGVFHENPDRVLRILRERSADEHDLVLEAAAHGWSDALSGDFRGVFPEIRRLARDGNYAERRTAALAPVEYYRDGGPTPEECRAIESHWEEYEDDPRSGLRNLVETQIRDRLVKDDD